MVVNLNNVLSQCISLRTYLADRHIGMADCYDVAFTFENYSWNSSSLASSYGDVDIYTGKCYGVGDTEVYYVGLGAYVLTYELYGISLKNGNNQLFVGCSIAPPSYIGSTGYATASGSGSACFACV